VSSLHDKQYLSDLVWLRHAKTPSDVWMQGLLVVAQYSDNTTSVNHIDELETFSADHPAWEE